MDIKYTDYKIVEIEDQKIIDLLKEKTCGESRYGLYNKVGDMIVMHPPEYYQKLNDELNKD